METLLTVSTQGGIVILAVAALRLILKKAPKRAICLLWLLAGLRLLLPVQIESPVSLQPEIIRGWEQSTALSENAHAQSRGEILNAAGEILVGKPVTQDSGDESIADFSQYDEIRGEILDAHGTVLVGKPLSSGETAEEAAPDWESWIPYIWLLGVAAMTASSIVAYLRLRRRVAGAVILSEGVWVTGNIDTAFVLGFFRPQIYLPAYLTGQEREFVLAHERSHIARRDHWWKLLGYATLSLHWFNPLVWLGYCLLCRDLEMACDENVVKTMDLSRRKAYSSALVSCAAVHHAIAACPVAFGEVSVKERVKNVLNFKKPGFWITLAALLAVIFVAVFLLTSPGMSEEEVLEKLYQQIQELQSNETKYLTYTIEMDSEFDYITEQHHEVWVSGGDWYHAIAYKTPMGGFTEGYMQLDGIQYAMDHSDEIEGFENRPWAQIPEENYSKLPPVLTKDFSKLEVVEIREENLDDGGKFSVVLRNDSQVTEPQKIYQDEYTFRLDEEGKLIGIAKYCHQNVYMRGFGLEGYFDTKSTTTFQILPFVEAEFSVRIKEAWDAVLPVKSE